MKSGRGPFGLSISATVGLVLVALFVFAAVLGPLFAPYSPTEQNLDNILAGPSWQHWLGTDESGVDVLSAMLYGARVALIISGVVTLISASLGTLLGLTAGYFKGAVDEVLMRIVDVLLAFPRILLNIAIVALVARPGVGTLIFALAANGWVGYARLVRGQTLSVAELEYVQAARCAGAGHMRIMLRHILPNIFPLVVVQMSLAFGGVIVVEASLSFLGLGPQLNYTWGALLDQGTTFLWIGHRLALIPGLAIMIVVLGSNLLGDGLRDRFDPKT